MTPTPTTPNLDLSASIGLTELLTLQADLKNARALAQDQAARIEVLREALENITTWVEEFVPPGTFESRTAGRKALAAARAALAQTKGGAE